VDPADPRGRVLLVDDDPLLLRALSRILRPEGHDLAEASCRAQLEAALEPSPPDVVLLDLFLARESGLELLERVKRRAPDVEVIVMTGHASVRSAVGCMQRGAFDYLEKPFEDVHRVRGTIRRAVERRRLVARNRALEEELRDRSESPLVGTSAAMRRLVRRIEGLRQNESHVLVTGESGTGKELVARALHAASPRRGGPFVPVDCGALPESIIESELFGHQRGAFTGAVGAPGLFRVADGGTLFLDEVGEIPIGVQAKLLRALQHKEVRPVGSAEPVPVDIRVVCATHRDLVRMVEEGSFRRDLFYRLNVVGIEVPPLRERREDIPLLAHHFLRKHRAPGSPVVGLEPEALEALCAHPWPGNVRELENAVESALALAAGERLRRADLRLGRGPQRDPRDPDGPDAHAARLAGELPLSLEAYERCALERALREAAGDATAAARRLGIGRSTLYRKLARHGITPGRRAQADVSRARAIR
jgi:DNA-binding NtrC family response regulator